MSTHNLCFAQKYEKYQNFHLKNFQLLVVKFSIYLNRCVFVMTELTIYMIKVTTDTCKEDNLLKGSESDALLLALQNTMLLLQHSAHQT